MLPLPIFLQLLIGGIAMGFIYALVAVHNTLIFNSTGLINFSQDKIVMLGAYVFAASYVLELGLPHFPAIFLALLTLALFGILIAHTIFFPLRNVSRLCAIIGTVMLGRIIVEGVRLIYGPAPIPVRGFFNNITFLGPVVLPNANIFIIATAIIVITLLQLFLTKTKPGKAMRCVAQNRMAAELMGINIALNMAGTVSISFAISCIIGIMVAPIFMVEFNMAVMIGLKGFAAGVIGGWGYLPGVIAGGLLIGILENLAAVVFPAVFRDVVAFAILILFLMFRPTGIFGKRA